MDDQAFLYPDADIGIDNKGYRLEPGGTEIGRQTENGLSIPLDSVSRRHAHIGRDGNRWRVSDLKSSNGTFLNGEKIDSAVLSDGDRITFGRATVTFRLVGPDVHVITSDPDQSSGLRIVAEEDDSSVILSTQLSDKTPYKSADVDNTAAEHLDKLNQRLLALYRLSDILRGESQRDRIVNALLELVFANLPADRGVILRIDDIAEELVPDLFKFREGSEKREFVLSRTILRRVLEDKVAVLIRDVRLDSRFKESESIMASDIRSAMCVPMAGKSSLMGILFLDTKEHVHAFSEDDLAFASALATDAAMTLENLQLMEQNIRQERLAAVGQTISELAHNIKNILQLARGGIELMDLAIQKKNLDDVNTLWPITKRSIERMQALTGEMLDFSRQSKLQLEPADINEVLRHLAEMIRTDKRVARVHLVVEYDDTCGMCEIDQDGLTKALMNLLTNSFDALEGQPEPEVRVKSEKHKGTAVIRVKDNGPGIPPEILPRIFQPFFSTKGSRGNGLGLSMTRKYIEDMGGRLEVKSELQKGSEFIIVLPDANGAH